MTAKLAALQRLHDAVVEGLQSPTNWRDFEAIPTGTNDTPGPILAHRAYYGSLDAAKALHEALLPGWEWWLNSIAYWDGDEGPTAILRTGTPMVDLRVASARSDAPACAWLIAVIRALMAQEGE